MGGNKIILLVDEKVTMRYTTSEGRFMTRYRHWTNLVVACVNFVCTSHENVTLLRVYVQALIHKNKNGI